MKPIRRLVWVLPHPTPYNTYLLNCLKNRLDVPSEAVYRYGVLKSHPWTDLPPRHFPSREIVEAGGRDKQLEELCATDPSVLVIFSGWRDKTIFPAMLRRWSNRLPYAFWSDTPKLGNTPARRLLNAIQVFFTRRAVALLATGSAAIETYSKMGVARDKLRNLPVVVDPAHFGKAVALRNARKATDDKIAFVFPARLIDKLKGQSVAIKALSLAKRALPGTSFRLILAGVGPDEEELRKFAFSQGAETDVEFRGWVEYDSAPEMYGEADALVIPSRWEPYGAVVIESLAAGLPVLGSEACVTVRERVVHGENGFMHQTGDAAELATHMVTLARSQALREKMGAHALRSSGGDIDISVTTMRALLAELSAA